VTKGVDGRLRQVFSDVLGCDPAALQEDDGPGKVRGWDSVNHMQLLLAIEDTLGVQFSPEEFATLTSFGALRRRLGRDDAAVSAE
jgi:acyl carrier protein